MGNKYTPKIRFFGFSRDWEQRKLSDVAQISSGGTPNRKESSYWNGTIPWATTAEVNYSVITDTNEKITLEGLNSSSAKLLPIGTILMAMYGQGKTRGKVAILGIEATTNQANANIVVSPKVVNHFIYYQLEKKYELLRNLANEGGQANLSLSIIKNISLSVSSNFSEQEKIGDFFKQIDYLITLHQQELTTLKQTKQGFLQKMFPKIGESLPEVRFPGVTSDWKDYRLSDIGSTYTGLSGKTKEDFGAGEGRFVTYKNVFANVRAKADSRRLEKVDISDGKHQNKVIKGDLLFTTSSETPEEVGMVSYWGSSMDNVYLNSFCFGYRINVPDIDPLFLAYLLRSSKYRLKITILAQGSTRFNLSKKELLKLIIEIPSIEEQWKIANFFKQLDNTIALYQYELDTLKQTKKALLQKMFV